MKKVLSLLCEIEDNANVILNSTSAKKSALNEQLSKDMEALDLKYANEIEEQLKKLQQKIEKEISNEHDTLVKAFETQLQELNANFQKNRETYVQTIFENIIKVQE